MSKSRRHLFFLQKNKEAKAKKVFPSHQSNEWTAFKDIFLFLLHVWKIVQKYPICFSHIFIEFLKIKGSLKLRCLKFQVFRWFYSSVIAVDRKYLFLGVVHSLETTETEFCELTTIRKIKFEMNEKRNQFFGLQIAQNTSKQKLWWWLNDVI